MRLYALTLYLGATAALLAGRPPPLAGQPAAPLASRPTAPRAGWPRLLLGAPPVRPGSLILVRHGETEMQPGAFIGWADPDLSAAGEEQVVEAARAIREAGYNFDVAYTSLLKRAVRTTWLLLQQLEKIHLPVWKTWRLNERCYGGLTGETIGGAGRTDLPLARRSLHEKPPPFSGRSRRHHAEDRRYARWQNRRGELAPITPPDGESLGDTIDRCLPIWHDNILPDLLRGKSVVVVAHGNTIRALVSAIDSLPRDAVCDLEIPKSIPLVYRFERKGGDALEPVVHEQSQTRLTAGDAEGHVPLSGEYLASAAAVAEGVHGVRQASLARWGLAPPVDASSARGTYVPPQPREEADGADGARKVGEAAKQQWVVIIRHGKTEHNKLGLFTGWEDAGLAAEGRGEATAAGKLLKRHGIEFDVVYTSWLSRAIETAWLVLVELDETWLPIHKSWRLNERMYGALTGLSKKKTRTVYGDAQFKKWRRGYDTKPPPVSSFSSHYPGNDQRYVDNIVDVRVSIKETLIRSLERGRLSVHRKLPRTESLKDCMERTIPYWINSIETNAIARGKSVMVASSENAIRGLLMHLLDIPTERIAEVEIPTGLPMVFDMRTKCLRLLEGDFTDFNFGKSGELLFTPCEVPDEAYAELPLESREQPLRASGE